MADQWQLALRDIFQLLPQVTAHGSALGQMTQSITSVSTDSRSCAPACLFVALKGENFDAHDFLDQVVERGARAVLIDARHTAIPAPGKVVSLAVPDTLAGLGAIGRHWRSRFDLPVIGVTGSNGKTTVKEMIASILNAAHGDRALATQGNLNNEIGLPLTLLRLREHHRCAVIEMGMNHPGEIGRLTAIAQPTVALVNNAQREHQEFMKSVEAVARENGAAIEGLAPQGTAVFPCDDAFTGLWRELAGQRKVLTFGLSPQADISAPPDAQPQAFTLLAQGQSRRVELAIPGQHNVRNALAAAACAIAVGVDLDTIVTGLRNFTAVKGRLQTSLLADGSRLIDDSYNANPDSVLAAIRLLQEKSPAILVLGDMGEVGEQGPQFHHEVGIAAAQAGLAGLFTFGQASRASHDGFRSYHATQAPASRCMHFESIELLVSALQELLSQPAFDSKGNPVKPTVLVKGSRSMRMERVVNAMLAAPVAQLATAEGAH